MATEPVLTVNGAKVPKRDSGLLTGWMRRAVLNRLENIQCGRIDIIDGARTFRFGPGEPGRDLHAQ